MSKREYGTGSISKHGSGFAARLRLESGERVNLGTYRTEDKAERALAGARKALEQGQWVTPGGVTLREFGERWLDRRELDGAHRSVDRERSIWRTHVLDAPFIDEPLGSITKLEVRRWAKGLMAKPVSRAVRTKAGMTRKTGGRTISRQTALHARNLLSSCFKAAVEDELLVENPLEGVTVPRDARVQEKDATWKYLEADEIALIEGNPNIPEGARAVLLTAIYTGLRKGELWGLKWEDVVLDGDRPHLVVRRSHKQAPKNGLVRNVPLLPRAREVLEAWKPVVPTSRAGWVFPREGGLQRRKDDDAGWFDRPYKRDGKRRTSPGHKTRAGITRKVRFHDLRHTCASHLVMGTWGRAWSLQEVRDFLGHSSIDVTERYAKLSPDGLHRAANETRVAALPARPQVPAAAPIPIGHKLATSTLAMSDSQSAKSAESIGTPGRIRTCDLRLRNRFRSARCGRMRHHSAGSAWREWFIKSHHRRWGK